MKTTCIRTDDGREALSTIHVSFTEGNIVALTVFCHPGEMSFQGELGGQEIEDGILIYNKTQKEYIEYAQGNSANTFLFEMPEGEVEIYGYFQCQMYQVTLPEIFGGKGKMIFEINEISQEQGASLSGVRVGDEVEFLINNLWMKEPYIIKKMVYTCSCMRQPVEIEVENVEGGNFMFRGAFTMPADDVRISVE